jgi:hypothetical protein
VPIGLEGFSPATIPAAASDASESSGGAAHSKSHTEHRPLGTLEETS